MGQELLEPLQLIGPERYKMESLTTIKISTPNLFRHHEGPIKWAWNLRASLQYVTEGIERGGAFNWAPIVPKCLSFSNGRLEDPSLVKHACERSPTLRKLLFYFLSNWMGYDRGDSFHLVQNREENCDYEFECHKTVTIQFEGKWNTKFLIA